MISLYTGDIMNRIAELRKKSQLSQRDFGKAIGAAQNTISNWENGTREPDIDALRKIAEFFNVSVDCLLGRSDYTEAPPSTGGVWVPVLGRVAAGIPIDAVEEIEDYEEIPKEMAKSGEHFGLKIQGNSMEPRMMPGDVVIVRKQSDCESGDVAVVLVNGEAATVKKIKKRPEGLLLIPNNPAYEPMFYSNDDIEKLPVKIIGKVVELRGKL